MAEVKRELVGGESAHEQARRVNRVLGDLAGADREHGEVDCPPRVREGIKGRSPLGERIVGQDLGR
jgi:hypothetical protein